MAARPLRSFSSVAKGASLPSPSGHFAVGCVDIMHKCEGDSDGLLMRLFYPAMAADQHRRQFARWMPHTRYASTTFDFIKAMVPGFSSNAMDRFTNPHIPAFEGAPLCLHDTTSTTRQAEMTRQTKSPMTNTQTTGCPVIVFCHGMGGMRTVSSGVCCDLASHGYTVAAIEHRDGSACTTLKRVPGQGGKTVDEWMEFYIKSEEENEFYVRNKQVKQRAHDARQALNVLHLLNEGGRVSNLLEDEQGFNFDQFKGRLDVERAAVMGHSFGGASTIQALSEDLRFVCGIGMDSWILPIDLDSLGGRGIRQPLLFINSYDWQWKRNIQRMMRLATPTSQCKIITMKDTHHFNQTDMPFTMSHLFDRRPNMVESRLPPLLAHQVNMELCHAFLRRHLLKDPDYQLKVPNLDGGVSCSEYVIHGSNVDLSTSAKL